AHTLNVLAALLAVTAPTRTARKRGILDFMEKALAFQSEFQFTSPEAFLTIFPAGVHSPQTRRIMHIFEDRYQFSEAAALADVPPKQVRNWIDRKQLMFRPDAEEEREGQSWRLFSPLDIARIAITKALVDFGIPVGSASLAAMGVFGGPANVAFLSKMPAA